MPLPSPRKEGLRAGRQTQVESSKSRLRGLPKSFVGNGFKPFPTAYAARSLPRALIRGRMRDAVATNKEQLLARPRDGERAGPRRRWAFFSSLMCRIQQRSAAMISILLFHIFATLLMIDSIFDPSSPNLVMREGAQHHSRECIYGSPTRDFACLRVVSPYPYFPIRKKTTGFCHSKQTPLLPERIPFRSSGVSFSRMMSYFSTFPRRSPV